MPFIPNYDSAAFPVQSEPDSIDFEIILSGIKGNGVVSGCAVTAQGTPNMTVAVASGSVYINGAAATVTAGNATITTANATQGRLDLVVASSAGALSVTAGTASNIPVMPSIPANSVVLACVYVPAADTAINANQIIDKRIFVSGGTSGGLADPLVFTTFGIR